MRKRLGGLAIVFGFLMACIPAFAHHGVSSYDMTSVVTVKGTVTAWEFINPHVLLHFEAKDEKGNVEKWTAETQGPNMMTRAGWNRDTLKPGDQITVIGRRAKNGSPSMRFDKVILSNGKEMLPYPY